MNYPIEKLRKHPLHAIHLVCREETVAWKFKHRRNWYGAFLLRRDGEHHNVSLDRAELAALETADEPIPERLAYLTETK